MNVLADQLATLDVHDDDRDVLDRIAKRFSHVDDNGCVFITGATDSNGRPRIGWLGRRHRVARVIVAIRDGLLVHEDWKWDTRHICHNLACVNPEHLTHGTRQQNADDCVKADRTVRGERHGNARQAEQQARAILQAEGTQQEIADRFGIHRSTVGKIKRGELWPHLHEQLQDEHNDSDTRTEGV